MRDLHYFRLAYCQLKTSSVSSFLIPLSDLSLMASKSSSADKSQPSQDKLSKLQQLQLAQTKPTKLNPIINSFTRKLINQREEEEKHDRIMLDEERIRESLDKLKTGKFVEGASTADGELAFDIQDCIPLKWYRENSKKIWITLIPDDIITPAKDIAPRQGVFAKAIKDSIHKAMHDCPHSFSKWFTSKGQILSPVIVDVNNSNPNDITAIFCPPTDIHCPNLIEEIKSLEAVVPIPYKPEAKPKKLGVFCISFSEFNPLDDVTVFALSFHIAFNAEAIRKDFGRAADIIIAFFETKGIHLSSPDFQISLPHPTKDDDKESKGKSFPAKLLIVYNAPDFDSLKQMLLNIGRLHGISIHIPDSISLSTNFSIRTHCKIFEHRIETERPLWTKEVIDTLHSEAQSRAAQNVNSVLKMLFCQHHIDERGEDLADIRKKLNLNEADNLALTDEKLSVELHLLMDEGILQTSPSDASVFMLTPTRRKWRSLKLVLLDHSVIKLQQKDLGIHLTSPFGLPSGQPPIFMACFYLTTSTAALATYNNPRLFTTHELWKYMTTRFKQYKSFLDSVPKSVLDNYAMTLQKLGAIEKERMTPSFLLEYAHECAESSKLNSFVNPLPAVCLAFPSELKRFNWMFIQAKDNLESQDIVSSVELLYHIKSDTKDAKTLFIKYVGSFNKGESFGHFVSLNVPPAKSDELVAKLISSTSSAKYIVVHSTWEPELLLQFPIKEAEHLVYESPIAEVIVIDDSPSLEAGASQAGSCAEQDNTGPQGLYLDEDEEALTSVMEHLELIHLRLKIAFSRISEHCSLDVHDPHANRSVLTRAIDELCIISREISAHIDQATTLKSHFPQNTSDSDTNDTLNPHNILRALEEQALKENEAADKLIQTLKGRIATLKEPPKGKPPQKEKEKPLSISDCILRIRSSFTVDSLAEDIEQDPSTKRLRLLNTFYVFPTKNSSKSFYHSVLIACSQPEVKSQLLQGTKSHFSYILVKEITWDVVALFEQSTKAMFRGYADCAICSVSNTTFNDYLERKKAPKNTWDTMPEDHFLCTPSLVAQAWQLNILIIWKKNGIIKVFALPHGPSDGPIIPILFSADKCSLDSDGTPTVVSFPTANRFFPLSVCEDKLDSWESVFTAESELPDSVQSTSFPLVVASFVKKVDKEFAFQSTVMVDGPAHGKEVSGDESSERTIDGMSERSQTLMNAFINDDSDVSEGPPSFNPTLLELDKEMAMRKLTEANVAMFRKMRKRRILDDDDEEVPLLLITSPPSARQPQVPSTTSSQKSSTPSLAPPSTTAPTDKPRRFMPARKLPDAKTAAATSGKAGGGGGK